MKILLVGAGGYASGYVSELLKNTDPSISLEGIVEPYFSSCPKKEEIEKANVPVYATMEEFYADHSADLALICTPTFLHCSQSIYALSRGSSVLCEKPVSPTASEGEKMLAAEKEYGRFIAIGYQWSFSDAILELKKDVLGYDELHPYDIYVPLSNAGDSFACDFEVACEKITEALAPLGEKYLTTLKKGFSEGWIDIYENKGKRSGAYSWGVYGVHPFVLLNYQKRYNSISTIAHEMGHALHSYFSSSAQTYINADYTIFCAEVASTTNEILLLEHTLKHASDEQKIYLLNQFLEAVRTTVYRQVQFAEFEKFIHSEISAGRTLQAEKLENYWLDSNKRYYGEALTVDKELASEWSRIPHFYTPFYVYKYATGYSAATAFAASILKGEEGAVEKYLGFLHAGGSDYSLNILKNAGVDLNTPQPVTVTLQKFAEKVAELKKLLGK